MTKFFLGFAEKVFVVLSLLIATGALSLWRAQSIGIVSQKDPLQQIIWFGIYAVSFILLVVQLKRVVGVVVRDKLLWVLVGFTVLSVLWSSMPEETLRRSLALAGTTLFGVYIAARYSLNEQLRLLAWALGIAVLLSLVVGLVLPIYGVTSVGWRGIYTQKNVLARIMVLAGMLFLILALSSNRHRWIAWTGLGLATSLLLLSTSKTSLVNFLVLLILFNIYKIWRLHYTVAIPLSIFGLLVVAVTANLLLSNWDSLLGSLGKDATLTGRTDIWAAVLEMIWRRPFLGYGYNGFWGDWNSPGAYVWQATNWQPIHAHNGFLELWLNLGLLGITVFVSGFLMNLTRAVSWIQLTKTAEGFWPLTYMTFIFLFNLTENTLIVQNNIFWILYVMVALSRPIQRFQARKMPTQAQS